MRFLEGALSGLLIYKKLNHLHQYDAKGNLKARNHNSAGFNRKIIGNLKRSLYLLIIAHGRSGHVSSLQAFSRSIPTIFIKILAADAKARFGSAGIVDDMGCRLGRAFGIDTQSEFE